MSKNKQKATSAVKKITANIHDPPTKKIKSAVKEHKSMRHCENDATTCMFCREKFTQFLYDKSKIQAEQRTLRELTIKQAAYEEPRVQYKW